MENIVSVFYMIVPFLAVLTIIVFVHEMGHYLVARWNGIAVQVFSIGFGPELFGFNDKNGTRWKVCAFPLGGYVKFLGDMNAASVPDHEELGQFDSQTKSSLFFYKNVWQRISVVVAGPIANILFTFLVLYALLIGLGRYTLEARIDGVEAQSPAAIAGFMPEDKIERVDGYLIRSFADFQRIVATSPNRDILVDVDRLGTQMTLKVRTGSRENTDQFGNVSNIGYLGVSRTAAQDEVVFVRPNPVEAIFITVDEMILIVDRSFKFLGELIVGRGDVEQLGGPVKIAKISGEAASIGIFTLINLMALLSLNIGIFNLFPIPMLDGGHLVYYMFEALRGKPLSQRIQEIGFRFGMLVVMSLMIFSLVNDIF